MFRSARPAARVPRGPRGLDRTNHLERHFRPIAIREKNWLFCWTKLGAKTWSCSTAQSRPVGFTGSRLPNTSSMYTADRDPSAQPGRRTRAAPLEKPPWESGPIRHASGDRERCSLTAYLGAGLFGRSSRKSDIEVEPEVKDVSHCPGLFMTPVPIDPREPLNILDPHVSRSGRRRPRPARPCALLA
jgi:hypothetical protein